MTSTIKVNNLQNQCGANTINKCGTAITVGASGDTVTLAAGASQSGFGQTYSAVSWDTTPKTTTVTGVAGVGYFVNTSGGAITANLPAGTAGDVIAFADYTRTFQTNNLTITPNGSEKVGGVAANFVAQTEGQSITLVYVDATEGWINTMDSTGQAGLVPAFITATGGTITTVCTDYKVHTFTGPGTFTVCSVGNSLGSNSVDYVVVAGGAGGGGGSYGGGTGGFRGAGGGGAGGFRVFGNPSSIPGFPSAPVFPLNASSDLPVSATGYPITVGGGGNGGCGNSKGINGSNSIFSTITSTGGGGGGADSASSPVALALDGGSGGGQGVDGTGGGTSGAGNTPPVSPPQGNPGGAGIPSAPNGGSAGGGGGALAAGSVGSPSNSGTNGGVGGIGGGVRGFGTSGVPSGSDYYFSGGGGGGNYADGGLGGGGKAGRGSPAGSPQCGTAATVNTGGGGGGTGGFTSDCNQLGGSGGSGIVIIRYKFQ